MVRSSSGPGVPVLLRRELTTPVSLNQVPVAPPAEVETNRQIPALPLRPLTARSPLATSLRSELVGSTAIRETVARSRGLRKVPVGSVSCVQVAPESVDL